MTHYCMLGNQPKMVLKGMENNQLMFDLSKDADIDVANETHMHAATIKFEGVFYHFVTLPTGEEPLGLGAVWYANLIEEIIGAIAAQ